MSERGVFAVDRGIWDHDLLTDSEPFSRREAWLWLVSEAAWKRHRRRIVGRQIELDRGQLVASTRFIASKWRWSEARVRRFLSALISEQMIDAKTDAGVSVITICKYDNYQRVSLPSDAMRESDGDAGATQERRKVEDREYKEYSEANASAPAGASLVPDAKPDPVFTDSKHELWSEGPPILGGLGIAERKARSLIGRWMRDARDDAIVVLSAIKRARENRVQSPVEWITRAIATGRNAPGGHGPPRSQNGYAALLVEMNQQDATHDQHSDSEPELFGPGEPIPGHEFVSDPARSRDR